MAGRSSGQRSFFVLQGMMMEKIVFGFMSSTLRF